MSIQQAIDIYISSSSLLKDNPTSALAVMQAIFVQSVQYHQNLLTQNKVEFVRQEVTVREDPQVRCNAILESIVRTKVCMYRMRTAPLDFTVGPGRNPLNLMIIQLEMLVRRVGIAQKGVTTSHYVRLALSRTPPITQELKIVYNALQEVIVWGMETQTPLAYVIRVFTVPEVN